MPESPVVERICPYLRTRGSKAPHTVPGEDNACLLASSIHLPRAQQTRYCLGGHFQECPRFQRQGHQPVPRYVRGARPVAVRPSAPTIPARTLPWRYPWVLPALKWLVALLLIGLFIYLWRWRMSATPPFVVEREPIPTPIAAPVQEISPLFLRPTAGPPPW